MKQKKLKKTKKEIKETVKNLTKPISHPLGSMLPVYDGLMGKFEMDEDWEEYCVCCGIKYIMRTQKDGVKINIKEK
jgi:hypothetical protein